MAPSEKSQIPMAPSDKKKSQNSDVDIGKSKIPMATSEKSKGKGGKKAKGAKGEKRENR
jgi:hypothetical protein